MPAVTQNDSRPSSSKIDSRPSSAKIDVGQRPVSISSLRRHDNDLQATDPTPDEGTVTLFFTQYRPTCECQYCRGMENWMELVFTSPFNYGIWENVVTHKKTWSIRMRKLLRTFPSEYRLYKKLCLLLQKTCKLLDSNKHLIIEFVRTICCIFVFLIILLLSVLQNAN